ncbi:GNAT family N-acetyltransferase [Porticoccaceae bacterium]|nr:GNAT family N-acetyltransferase [Porticoccaceae bacterium]
MPRRAITDNEIDSCFNVMAELRPHLKRSDFVATVRAMEADGFCLAFIEQEGEIVAAAGYRICTNLFMGKHCYIDDLVTAESHRSKGFGEQMIDWLRAEAKAADCQVFHLDSGTQRDQAHKFYFSQGLTIASYHFSEALTQ